MAISMSKKQPSGKRLYLILWGGTATITAAMVLIGFRQQLYEKNLLRNPFYKTENSSGEAINELLLSANELTIAEKKSFINHFLKQANNNEETTPDKTGRKKEDIYKVILQRKINRLNGKTKDDFSVRPVPK